MNQWEDWLESPLSGICRINAGEPHVLLCSTAKFRVRIDFRQVRGGMKLRGEGALSRPGTTFVPERCAKHMYFRRQHIHCLLFL